MSATVISHALPIAASSSNAAMVLAVTDEYLERVAQAQFAVHDRRNEQRVDHSLSRRSRCTRLTDSYRQSDKRRDSKTAPEPTDCIFPAVYQPHPSRLLGEHFARRPYQGGDPQRSRCLFVGLDANYAADIENSAIFPSLLRYHEDGPGFWRQTGVHHPFLLPEYRGDGRRYHRTFAKIGFQPQHAEQVSFIELVDVPTVGRSRLAAEDLNKAHLERVRSAIFEGDARFVFVSAGVQRLMAMTGLFPELGSARRANGALRVLHERDGRTIFLHLHFSNYGKFEQQLQAEAREIAGLIGQRDA